MALPIEFQIEQLMHRYDPIKAHEYYIKTRKLKGRKSASDKPSSTNTGVGKFGGAPKHLRKQVAKASRSAQRKKLAIAIHDLEQKLNKLEFLLERKHTRKLLIIERVKRKKSGRQKKKISRNPQPKRRSLLERIKSIEISTSRNRKQKLEVLLVADLLQRVRKLRLMNRGLLLRISKLWLRVSVDKLLWPSIN